MESSIEGSRIYPQHFIRLASVLMLSTYVLGVQEGSAGEPQVVEDGHQTMAPAGPQSVVLKGASNSKSASGLPLGFSEVKLVCGMIGMMARREGWHDAQKRMAAVQIRLRASYERIEKNAALARLPCALRPDLSGRSERPCHYFIYVPKEHSSALERKFPLLLFLHGAGGNFRFGFEQSLDLMKKNGMILVCPSFKNGEWWTPEGAAFAMRVLEDVASRYRIDSQQLLIGGVSNGATGAWIISQQHRKRFAGVISICGSFGGKLPSKPDPGPPLFIVHGEKDGVIPVKFSRAAFAALKNRKGTTYKEVPGAGHLVAVEHPEVGLTAALEWFKRLQEKGVAERP